MKFCVKCGNQLFDEAVMCPKCGCATEMQRPSQEEQEVAKTQAKGAIFILAGIALLVIMIFWAIAQYNGY